MFSFMVLSTGRLMKVIFPGISASKEYRLQCRRSRFHLWVRSSPGEGIVHPLQCSWASLVARLLKNPPAVWETWVGKIPWMTAWQPTSVFLPGESPWTGKSGRLQSTGSQRVGQAWATKHTPQHKKWTRMSMSRWKDTYNSSIFIHWPACMRAQLRRVLTLCDPMDCSPPGSSVHGVFQASILEWAAISSSRGSSWPRD